jgi:hypothetical protein
MHKHETGKTRITLERVTVTTIRRGGAAQPVYCEICKQLIDPNLEPLLLEAANHADNKNDEIKPTEKKTKEKSK